MNTDKKSSRVMLVMTPRQRERLEAIQLQLAKRGQRASLSAVAMAILERGLQHSAAA